MKIDKCLNCGREFERKMIRRNKLKAFCCYLCRTRYKSREHFEKFGNMYLTKENVRLSLRKNYKKNKDKWISRSYLHDMIKEGTIFLEKKCKICGNKKNLEIHHEEYPSQKKYIIESIKNKKIYYLCRTHHRCAHRKEIDYSYKPKYNPYYKRKKDGSDYLFILIKKKGICNFYEMMGYISSNKWLTKEFIKKLENQQKIVKVDDNNWMLNDNLTIIK